MIWCGAETVILVLGSGCKFRLSLAERFDCTETIINQLLADLYQNPNSEWQVKTSSGLPLILHYGELYNYFIIYYNVIIIEIKCTINVMPLYHPETIPPAGSWKNCLPQNWSLVPKRLGTAELKCISKRKIGKLNKLVWYFQNWFLRDLYYGIGYKIANNKIAFWCLSVGKGG